MIVFWSLAALASALAAADAATRAQQEEREREEREQEEREQEGRFRERFVPLVDVAMAMGFLSPASGSVLVGDAASDVAAAEAAGLRLAQLSEGQRRRAALAQLWLPQVAQRTSTRGRPGRESSWMYSTRSSASGV